MLHILPSPRTRRRRDRAVRGWMRWLRRQLRAMLSGLWYERARGRTRLAGLDQRMLHDIGISHADAWREWRKPFWRA